MDAVRMIILRNNGRETSGCDHQARDEDESPLSFGRQSVESDEDHADCSNHES